MARDVRESSEGEPLETPFTNQGYKNIAQEGFVSDTLLVKGEDMLD